MATQPGLLHTPDHLLSLAKQLREEADRKWSTASFLRAGMLECVVDLHSNSADISLMKMAIAAPN